MAIDSEAVFANRLKELDLHDLRDKFVNAGWKTYGNFAFAVPSQGAGAVDETVFRAQVVNVLCEVSNSDPAPPQSAALRRLFFESHALAVGELRNKLERTDTDAPRKIPAVERESRKKVL